MSVKYDEYFTEASKKYNIDKNLLIAVAQAESSLNPNAVSSAGAVGIMQLMPVTAKDLGVTNRYDPQQNIDGGAKYLSILLKEFNGDMPKALSAYNAGPGNVKQNGGVLSSTEPYINNVMTNYKAMTLSSHSSSGGSFGDSSHSSSGRHFETAGLVWWGDIVRVVLIMGTIACGAVFMILALESIGVPLSKEDIIKKGVKQLTDGE